MKKIYFIFIFGLFAFQSAKAQKQDTLMYYMKESGIAVDNRDSADYYLLVMPLDSSTGKKLYPVKEFYPNMQRRLVGTSTTNNYKTLKFDDVCISYFPNDKPSRMVVYKAGVFSGKFSNYYPNGQLYNTGLNYDGKIRLIECRDSTGKVLAENGNGKWVYYDNLFKTILTEGNITDSLKDGEWHALIGNRIVCVDKYIKGNLVSGIYYDVKGREHPFTGFEVEPAYEGGLSEFRNFLGGNIKYPAIDKQNNIQGKVIITFAIERDGVLSHIKILRSPTELMAAEAIRVIGLSPRWIPGFQNGMPVRVQYTVPISFTLNATK